MVEIWEYAISKKIVSYNEARATLKRSTSKKLVENRKKRKRLNIYDYWVIHDASPLWLQVAMDQSLVTLQSRSEITNMLLTDYKEGFLYVIREKVAYESDMGFIKIQISPEIERIKNLAIQDGIASPYLVRRRPSSKRKWEGQKHWPQANPEYLSKQFAK